MVVTGLLCCGDYSRQTSSNIVIDTSYNHNNNSLPQRDEIDMLDIHCSAGDLPAYIGHNSTCLAAHYNHHHHNQTNGMINRRSIWSITNCEENQKADRPIGPIQGRREREGEKEHREEDNSLDSYANVTIKWLKQWTVSAWMRHNNSSDRTKYM
jgi:hypothetical protein